MKTRHISCWLAAMALPLAGWAQEVSAPILSMADTAHGPQPALLGRPLRLRLLVPVTEAEPTRIVADLFADGSPEPLLHGVSLPVKRYSLRPDVQSFAAEINLPAGGAARRLVLKARVQCGAKSLAVPDIEFEAHAPKVADTLWVFLARVQCARLSGSPALDKLFVGMDDIMVVAPAQAPEHDSVSIWFADAKHEPVPLMFNLTAWVVFKPNVPRGFRLVRTGDNHALQIEIDASALNAANDPAAHELLYWALMNIEGLTSADTR